MRPAILAAALVLLAACGSDKPAATTTSTTGATGATTSTTSTSTTGASSTTGAEPRPDRVRVEATEVANVESPTAMTPRPGTDDLYVAERAGRVRVLAGGKLQRGALIDISSNVSTGGERGLLGLAFSPDGTRLYLSYTNPDGDSRIDEYRMDGDRVERSTRRQILAVKQPYPNHNGGDITFGPDGYLWFGLGDGGSGGDPRGNGQNPSTLLGSVLRIDPLHGSASRPYAIPADNPFADGRDGRPEVWLYGVRNPWRFSFDRATGDLWIGDVGQDQWEEIDHLPAPGRGRGANLGWNRMEGTHPYNGGAPPKGYVGPVYDYAHGSRGCSVTGGYVYRGTTIANLAGAYLFSDYCAGGVQALVVRGGTAAVTDLHVDVQTVVSFGEDRHGEVYVLSLNGGVYRLDAA